MPIIKMPDGTNVIFPDEMSGEEIKGIILKKFPDLNKKRNSEINISDEQKAQIASNNLRYEQKQTKNGKFVNNPAIRAVASAAQGISNATFNPAGYVARGLGVDTKPIKPRNAMERAIEKIGEYGFDSAALAATGGKAKELGLLGSGTSKSSKIAQAVLAPSVGSAMLASGGGGALEGILEPEGFLNTMATNIAGGAMATGGAGLLKSGANAVKSGTDSIYNYGKRKVGENAIKKQLSSGGGFKDVSLGKLDYDKVSELNRLRNSGLPRFQENSSLVVPKNVMEKLHTKRVQGEGYNPQEVVDTIRDAFFSKKGMVGYGDYPHIQSVINANTKPASVGFVSVNPSNNGTVAKTVFRENTSRALKRLEPERRGAQNLSSSQVLTSEGKAAGARLSDLQSSSYNNVANNSQTVNNQMGLYNALHDNNHVRALKMGIKVDDGVAKRVFNERQEIANALNNEANEALYKALPHDFDTKKALASQSSAYQDVIKQQGKEKIFFGSDNKVKNPTVFQKETAQAVLKQADKLTNYPRGTVAHTNKIKQALNAIEQKALTRQASLAEIEQIRALQNQVNGTLRNNSTIKLRDERFAKVLNADKAYERGKTYNPNQLKNEVPWKNTLERNAFAKGFMEKVLVEAKDDEHVAAAILKNSKVFKELLTDTKYKRLMEMANDIDLRATRLVSLGNRSAQKIDAASPLNGGFFGREQIESKGAALGATMDYIATKINKKGITNRSRDILNNLGLDYAPGGGYNAINPLIVYITNALQDKNNK